MTNEKNKEIDTSYLLSVIQGKDKQPVIPKIVDDNRLEHFLLNDQTLLKITVGVFPNRLTELLSTLNK